MNRHEGKPEWERIWPGDPQVCLLLGRQQPPAPEGRIRGSRFVYSLYTEGRYLLFHTLTRQLIAVEPQLIAWFSGDRSFPASVLEEASPARLYGDFFLVPEETEEDRLYLELKDILVLREELPRDIVQYVILPTTACNARCFYCFEQGMRYRSMDAGTVEDTVRFIRQHRPADSRAIRIHWFGGEPLCAADNIDRICAGLVEAGIDYTAEMTSNGSLFTEALVRKAREMWKLDEIQITLDGMAEEYARRKRYAGTVKDPFGTVIRNVHRLLAGGIRVTVRLNVDENNLGEIYRVAAYLTEEFPEEERKKMRVYAHSLFGELSDGPGACPVDAGTEALEARVLEVNDYLRRLGLIRYDLDTLFRLKSHYCMVTAPECNVLIDAEGRLFACDAMPDSMRYGDVRTGIDPEAWKRVAAPCGVSPECRRCVFLPQCTDFSRCPSRVACDSCRRIEKMKLDRDLRAAWALHREAQARQRAEAEAEGRKEAPRVSD